MTADPPGLFRFACPQCGNAISVTLRLGDCIPEDLRGWCTAKHIRPVAMVRQEKP